MDTEAGTDSKSTADMGGAVAGAEASAGSTIVTTGAGADMQSMVVGTNPRDDAVVVVGVQVGTIAEMIPSACAAVSKFSVPANAWLGITRTETEQVE